MVRERPGFGVVNFFEEVGLVCMILEYCFFFSPLLPVRYLIVSMFSVLYP